MVDTRVRPTTQVTFSLRLEDGSRLSGVIRYGRQTNYNHGLSITSTPDYRHVGFEMEGGILTGISGPILEHLKDYMESSFYNGKGRGMHDE